MHTLSTSFVLGYHGCDHAVGERLLNGEAFKKSTNLYDWLGHGIYFWEANPVRGLEYAKDIKKQPGRGAGKITKPAVVGAVIDLGLCLDLTTSAGVEQVKIADKLYRDVVTKADAPLPTNSSDKLRRNLDCAVMEWLHKTRADTDQPPVDTVKGVFIEGDPIYPTAGFYMRTHVQLCVCNPDCIKAVFRVPNRHLETMGSV